MKEFLSNPVLFLIVIAMAIIWQQMNSKRLAMEAGQGQGQATFFSIIMAVSIFLCVANGYFEVALIGAGVEAGVNIFLVFKKRQPFIYDVRIAREKLGMINDKERKGKEILELTTEINDLKRELSPLTLAINLFIGVLMPTFIVFMSELYIGRP